MELAVKAQPFLVSTMRIAVSGNAGFEETGLADGVMDGVLVLLCGELVGTTGAWDDDMEPVVLHAPSSSARARMSNRGSHATCVGFLHIFLSPFVFFSTCSYPLLNRLCSTHAHDTHHDNANHGEHGNDCQDMDKQSDVIQKHSSLLSGNNQHFSPPSSAAPR